MLLSSLVLHVLDYSFLTQVRMKVLLLIVFLTLETNASKIVKLPQSNEIIVELDQQTELNLPMTFCLRFKLDRQSMNKYRAIFHDINEIIHLDLDVSTQMGVLFIGKGSMIFSILENSLHPNQWNHVCMSISQHDYTLVANGYFWFKAEHSVDPNTTILANQIILGKAAEKIASSNEFIGALSELNIWKQSISLDELIKLTNSCQILTPKAHLIDWNEAQITGNVQDLDFCNFENQGIEQFVPFHLNLEYAGDICKTLGATLSMNNGDIFENLVEKYCSNILIPPIRKENGLWMNIESNQEVNMTGK